MATLTLHADPLQLAPDYRGASPFPHIVLDDLFDAHVLRDVLADFPAPEATRWVRFSNAREEKLGFDYRGTRISERVRRFLDAMNGFEMLEFLEHLTGIDGLIPDPYFGGGGLHQIQPGGFLKLHVDFNFHPKLRLHRRLNMLVFLNESWPEAYGGHLELWNRRPAACARRILPVFNRTVIFSTSEESCHGHPEPLTCPAGRTRKSVSLYYYTAEPADGAAAPHDTIFEP